jgi:hypothetical protein
MFARPFAIPVTSRSSRAISQRETKSTAGPSAPVEDRSAGFAASTTSVIALIEAEGEGEFHLRPRAIHRRCERRRRRETRVQLQLAGENATSNLRVVERQRLRCLDGEVLERVLRSARFSRRPESPAGNVRNVVASSCGSSRYSAPSARPARPRDPARSPDRRRAKVCVFD